MEQQDYPRMDRDLLIRLTTKFESMEEKFETLLVQQREFKREFEITIKSIRDDAERKYVTKEQFEPYKELLDTMRKKTTAAVISGVIAAVLAVGALPRYYSEFAAMKAVPKTEQEHK